MSGNPMDQGYVMVAERHAKFVEEHPDGAVVTTLVGFSPTLVVVRAEVYKDRSKLEQMPHAPDGTGLASMPIPGPTPFTKNSEVENAETSALGRALAMIGYHPKNTMASQDEIAMKKADAEQPAQSSDVEQLRGERAKIMAWATKVFGSKDEAKAWLKAEFEVAVPSDIKTMEQAAGIKKMLAIHKAAGTAPAGVTLDD